MYEKHYVQMMQEAIAAYPNEAVWLITTAGCRMVENVSPTPESHFDVRDADTLKAMKEGLLAVVHSHPSTPPAPSEADMRGQLASGVPWGIIGTDGSGALPPFWWGADTPIPDLRQRGFHHGITDCYSLIRDFYRTELNTTLPEFPRSWEWWVTKDLYNDGLEPAGFVEIPLNHPGSEEFLGLAEEPKRGDMWFTQIHARVPNHAGIYLGDGLCLHHLSGSNPIDTTRQVREEPIYRWASHVVRWFRHKDFM